jgi:hypothetical protein
MANINQRGNQNTDPVRNFRFLVHFQPITPDATKWDLTSSVGFTSVSGLAISTQSIPYREGGFNTTIHQIPGQSTFSPVTLQRGVVVGSRKNWDWMSMLFQAVGGTNYNVSQSFRCNVVVDVLNHPVPYSTSNASTQYGSASTETTDAEKDVIVARFRLYNAWPTTLAYSDLNAGDNALMVEQMTLVHEGLDMEWATVDTGTNLITGITNI